MFVTHPNELSSSVAIKGISNRELKEVGEVHICAFTESALTKLGLEAVRRYYEWQLNGPHDSMFYGAFENDKLIGFCVGGSFKGAMSGYLKKNRTFLIWRVMTHPWLVMNSLFRDKLKNAFHILKRFNRKPVEIVSSVQHDTSIRHFGILSICVHPQYQKHGIGKLLMKEAERKARSRGFNKMLLTVKADNQKAISFYKNIGWEQQASEQIGSVMMVKELVK